MIKIWPIFFLVLKLSCSDMVQKSTTLKNKIVKLISHRGDHYDENGPFENTKEAFDRALSNFQILETDLRLSKDGELILAHDEKLSRISSVEAKISDFSADDLQKITLKRPGQIMKAKDFLNNYKNKEWVLDIKQPTGSEVLHKLKALSEQDPALKSHLDKNTIFLPWNDTDDALISELFPKSRVFASDEECHRVGVGLIVSSFFTSTPSFWFAKPRTNRIYALTPSFKLWTFNIDLMQSKFVNAYHTAQVELLAYLPKSSTTTRIAKEIGFDYILLDNSGLLF